MKVKVLTLRWDDETGGLDDQELEAFMEDRAVLEVSEHFFIHDKQPTLVLTLSYRDEPAEDARRGKRAGKDNAARPDPRKDLALVSFETRDTVPLAELGDSDRLEVGDWVLAVGNPLGFSSTITSGIVSALGRHAMPGSDLAGFTDYIQTDAAINQGNSGGALVNIEGQVVGISTWIASPSGGSVGLGFAIPINNARRAIEEFITQGKVAYGWLGISMATLPEQDAASLYGKPVEGAFVQGVYRGSPAAQAGLQPGDTIVAVNGESITDPTELLLAVGNLSPGTSASLAVHRDRREIALSTEIGQREDEQALGGQASRLWPGLAVVRITPEIRSQLGLPRASGEVIVSSVVQDSPAQVAGFEVGDIVLEADGQAVRDLEGFYRAVNEGGRGELTLTVRRKGEEHRVGLVR